MKNWKTTLGAVALSTTMFAAGAAFTAGAHAQTVTAPATMHPMWQRGEGRSNHNLWHVRRRLEALIDELSHDQRDYGGHRVTALNDMQQARAELDQAIQYDKAHPGQ